MPYASDMHAIRVHQFGPPDVMKLEVVPDPQPAADQILVRINAVGVNPVDTYIRSGSYGALPALPYTPGADAAGTTADGQRVYVSGSLTGTYAELCVCERRQVHPLPDRLTFAQGAAIGIPYVTAYAALHVKAKAKPGETVLIHGASGGVGIAAVQLALAHGCRVIGTAGSERGLALLRELGVHQILNHRDADYLQGVTVDVILEMLANVNLAKDLTILNRYGRVAVIGNRGTIEINPREIMRREATIVGVFATTTEDVARIHAALSGGFADGTLCPVIGQEMKLTGAASAHEAVMQSRAAGKIVLLP